jgi:hypothetical protein
MLLLVSFDRKKIDAEHLLIENSTWKDDVFKNWLNKKGVENFYLSNNTDKSI